MLKVMIPQSFRSLFWDINIETFDPVEFPQYTIARILEYGERGAIDWMRQTFPEVQIVSVIRTERRLSRKSANFWALIYGLSHNEVAALKDHS